MCVLDRSSNNLINSLVTSKTNKQAMPCRFFGDEKISPNECDTTPPPDIDKTAHTPSQSDSISDVYEPLEGPSHPSNENLSPEEYGLTS